MLDFVHTKSHSKYVGPESQPELVIISANHLGKISSILGTEYPGGVGETILVLPITNA